ncbi:MAG: radical SAM protein [Desulfobacteraceae bacterium]|nr:radical SAM protein [Desulfobacteraceae bacterium]MBC2754251.1 radical SAM protein [Desulfobacteraceae bacterium]
MKKVLLISANTETINMPVLPLGLAFVNAALLAQGFETKMINLMGAADAQKFLKETLNEFHPDAIGISVRNIDTQDFKKPVFMLDPVKSIISWCRKYSNAPVIIGGPGYSIYPDAALDYLGADMGIKGEGEAAFPELLRRISNHQPITDIPGLYLPQKGAIKTRQCIRQTAKIHFPLPGIHLNVPDAIKGKDLWIPFQTRRGCPMDCSYCSTGSIEGRLIRKFPIKKGIETLAAYADAGFKQFFFVDNTFNLPPSHAEALCEGIIAENLSISWRCILYPANINERLVHKMSRAGCREVALGFESGADAILKNFNKRFNTADILKTSIMLKKYGIAQMGFLMLGGPGETKQTVMESLDFAETLKLDSMKLTTGIRIYPDTPLADLARKEGVIHPDDDLLMPTFYIRKELEDWLIETIYSWVEDRPNCFF